MGGLFSALDVASRALLVNQAGLRTTGNNIANVNNPNYSRQRAVLETLPPDRTSAGELGQGVEQRSVERLTDEFVNAALVRERASSSSLESQAQALSRIEDVFNEQDGPGLTAALSELYDGFQDLASTPTPGAAVEREGLRANASGLVSLVHRQDAELRMLQREADRTIVARIGEVNALATRIAELNGDIVKAEITAPANGLRDQRDQALRELADRIDVSTFNRDDGGIVVQLTSGIALVDGDRARSLEAVADPTNLFDPTFSRVVFTDGTNRFDITDDIGGGELGGLLRVRDTLAAQAIRDLDTVAYNLVRTVNTQHQAGLGLDGAAHDFFLDLAQVEDSARNLALDADVLANTDAIAAGQTADPGDNRNALALAALRETAAPLFLPGDPPGPASGPSRSLLDHASGMVAGVGREAARLAAASGEQQRVLQTLEDRRDEISGVSLDEEVVSLVRLQAAFQANARVVATINRMLDEIVSLL